MVYNVYVIGDLIDLITKDYTNCYIGVTNNVQRRWKNHIKSGYSVSKAIKENRWIFNENMMIIFQGSSLECFDMENSLRPNPNMGLNEACGGNGGYTSYSKNRNMKISIANKGIPKTTEFKNKLSITRKEKQLSVGKNNPRAKQWKITSPLGIVYFINGKLHNFCDKYNLTRNALIKNLNKPVGPISTKYRDSGFLFKQKRLNTIGWKMEKCNYIT